MRSIKINFSTFYSVHLSFIIAFIIIAIIKNDFQYGPMKIMIAKGQTIENFTTANLMLPDYYTFTKLNSHIRLSANKNITDKLIHSKKEISFDFR